MNSARDDVFTSIRTALGVTSQEQLRRTTVKERLLRRPVCPVPLRETGSLVELFKHEAARNLAAVACLASVNEVPAFVARHLPGDISSGRIALGEDPHLLPLPWEEAGLSVVRGPTAAAEKASIARAFGAVAETGAVALIGGPENPTVLNFLPDIHFVILESHRISDCLESLLVKLRAQGPLPRAINLVSGPSRTADIEQTLLLGAHGPKYLHVMLVNGSEPG